MKTCVLFLLLGSSFAAAEITRGPYLQLSHSEGITVVWRGDQDLENSLSDFERGVALMSHCHTVLKAVDIFIPSCLS